MIQRVGLEIARPQLPPARDVDEVDSHANAALRPPDRPLHDVTNLEPASDFPCGELLSLEAERRGSGGYAQFVDRTESGCQLIRNPVAERLIRRVAADIAECEHGDRSSRLHRGRPPKQQDVANREHDQPARDGQGQTGGPTDPSRWSLAPGERRAEGRGAGKPVGGAFASAFATARSTASGNSGRMVRRGGTGSSVWRASTAWAVLAWQGRCPASISYSTEA